MKQYVQINTLPKGLLLWYVHMHTCGGILGHATEVSIISDAGLSRFPFSDIESSASMSTVEVTAVLSL